MRKDNWPKILEQYISKHKGKPFVRGENDCCTFSGGAADAISDSELVSELRRIAGDYKSDIQAARAILSIGSIDQHLDKILPSIPVKMAQRGDFVYFDETDSLAIVSMDGRRGVCPYEGDLRYFPIDEAIKAWRIE